MQLHLRPVVFALVIAGCTEPTARPPAPLGPVERALIEEIVTEAALSGIWSGTRSGPAPAPAVYNIGMGHSLPGADGGLLIAITVAEFGSWPLVCDQPVPGQPWRACSQLLTTRPDWAEGLVRILPSQDSPERGVSYRSTRLDGEFRFQKPPTSTWRVDFRPGLRPTIGGRLDESVTLVLGSGTAAVDLSHSGTTNFSWADLVNSALTVHLEFPRLHSCGTVIVDLRDNGHDVVEGTVRCGLATVGRIGAAEQLYAFTWLP